MRCEIDDDLSAFWAEIRPWLEREPVRNNVLHTVTGSRARGEVPVEPDPLWIRVLGDDGLAAVAIQTPPHGLLVSDLPDGAAEALAGAVAGRQLPGVSGPAAASRAFAQAWQARTGATAKLGMAQRMYRLDAVTAPVGVPGRLRAATADDEDLAVAWTYGFVADAGTEPDGVAEGTRRWLAAGRIWLWDVDGEPVSMAGDRTPVAGVPRISLVYTPPERRRNGYAAACVAALSQLLLDGGAPACMLYTDLANPTSNSVYQRIGYHPVTDAEIWRFDQARSASG